MSSPALVRPPFPRVISNSMRAAFTCPRKFELSELYHWKPKRTSVHLHAGGAFAKGLETTRRAFYTDGLESEAAIERGWLAIIDAWSDYLLQDGEVKSLERMLSAFLYYFTVWPLDSDFVRPFQDKGIEFSFSIPLPVEHPETGDPLILAGRFDMLGQHSAGPLYVVDEKTASQLGASWVEGWKLDGQFTEYCWAAQQYGFPVVGAIVRGISILKTGHGHAQSLQTRSKFMIDAWYTQLLRDVERMIALWKEGYFDRSYGPVCKMYGGCSFRQVCAAPNPLDWLEADFEVRPYKPYEEEVK